MTAPNTSLVVDLCHEDETLQEALATLTAGLTQVTTTVENERGPGGGWPVVRFDGPLNEVIQVSARYAGPDATLTDIVDFLVIKEKLTA